MKRSLIRQLKSEDWVIVGAGAAILLLALLFPRWMPAMPKDLSFAGNWMSAGAMFLFLLVLTGVCQRILGRPLRRFAVSLLAIFGVALLSQAVASIPAIKRLGFEAVFFSVIFGLVISNFFRVPEWLKPAIQSEFYIKIGIVCLGATILFGEVLQSGVYALIQAFIVVFTVWYFAFWLARRMRVDEETSTMLASSVSICGVSAAIGVDGWCSRSASSFSSAGLMPAWVDWLAFACWRSSVTCCAIELKSGFARKDRSGSVTWYVFSMLATS